MKIVLVSFDTSCYLLPAKLVILLYVIQLCLMASVLMGVFAEPEALPEAEAAFDPTNYPKPSSKASYGQKYKGGNDYCHPRKAPTCSKNGTLAMCLKDPEYPEKEVKVIYI